MTSQLSSTTPTASPATATEPVSSSTDPPSSSTSRAAAATTAPAAASQGSEYRDPNPATTTPGSSASSVNGDDPTRTPNQALARPKMGTRKSSGTIIVPREHPRVELKEGDEVFDADDARAMSPRRSSQDLEKMGQEARAQLNEYVLSLASSPCFQFTSGACPALCKAIC
jgi:hypothetical protein